MRVPQFEGAEASPASVGSVEDASGERPELASSGATDLAPPSGVGSVFTVTLPLHQKEEVLIPPAPLEHDDETAPEEAHATV